MSRNVWHLRTTFENLFYEMLIHKYFSNIIFAIELISTKDAH